MLGDLLHLVGLGPHENDQDNEDVRSYHDDGSKKSHCNDCSNDGDDAFDEGGSECRGGEDDEGGQSEDHEYAGAARDGAALRGRVLAAMRRAVAATNDTASIEAIAEDASSSMAVTAAAAYEERRARARARDGRYVPLLPLGSGADFGFGLGAHERDIADDAIAATWASLPRSSGAAPGAADMALMRWARLRRGVAEKRRQRRRENDGASAGCGGEDRSDGDSGGSPQDQSTAHPVVSTQIEAPPLPPPLTVATNLSTADVAHACALCLEAEDGAVSLDGDDDNDNDEIVVDHDETPRWQFCVTVTHFVEDEVGAPAALAHADAYGGWLSGPSSPPLPVWAGVCQRWRAPCAHSIAGFSDGVALRRRSACALDPAATIALDTEAAADAAVELRTTHARRDRAIVRIGAIIAKSRVGDVTAHARAAAAWCETALRSAEELTVLALAAPARSPLLRLTAHDAAVLAHACAPRAGCGAESEVRKKCEHPSI